MKTSEEFKKLQEIFKKYSPDEVIGSISDGGNYYIVYLTRPNVLKGDFVTDNLYMVSKRDYKPKPFVIAENKALYKNALKNIIYMKPGLKDE